MFLLGCLGSPAEDEEGPPGCLHVTHELVSLHGTLGLGVEVNGDYAEEAAADLEGCLVTGLLNVLKGVLVEDLADTEAEVLLDIGLEAYPVAVEGGLYAGDGVVGVGQVVDVVVELDLNAVLRYFDHLVEVHVDTGGIYFEVHVVLEVVEVDVEMHTAVGDGDHCFSGRAHVHWEGVYGCY